MALALILTGIPVMRALDAARFGSSDVAAMETQIWNRFAQKKTARTFYGSCREASDATYFQLRIGNLYRLHHWNIYTIA
jgi:hypothetical protein